MKNLTVSILNYIFWLIAKKDVDKKDGAKKEIPIVTKEVHVVTKDIRIVK